MKQKINYQKWPNQFLHDHLKCPAVKLLNLNTSYHNNQSGFNTSNNLHQSGVTNHRGGRSRTKPEKLNSGLKLLRMRPDWGPTLLVLVWDHCSSLQTSTNYRQTGRQVSHIWSRMISSDWLMWSAAKPDHPSPHTHLLSDNVVFKTCWRNWKVQFSVRGHFETSDMLHSFPATPCSKDKSTKVCRPASQLWTDQSEQSLFHHRLISLHFKLDTWKQSTEK